MANVPPADLFDVQQGELVFWMEMVIPARKYFYTSVIIALGFNEIICTGLIWSILSKLKTDSTKYSKNTLKLHLQFTILLAFQVCYYLCFGTFY